MNRKERRLALRTAFFSRLEDIVVVEDFSTNLPKPKSKELFQALGRWGVPTDAKVPPKVLLIVDQKDETVFLSARNLPNLILIAADQLNVFDIVTAKKIVVTAPALATIQSVYQDQKVSEVEAARPDDASVAEPKSSKKSSKKVSIDQQESK